MSVYLPTPKSVTYYYSFEWKGQRYQDTTYQTDKAAARLVEAKKKLDLRAQAGGLVPVGADDTPLFTKWAAVTLAYYTAHIKRPDILERTLRMVLAFFGARPARPLGPAAAPRAERVPRPYHNLRLGDVIRDPSWLEKFEQWMEARGLSGSAKNSYMSAASNLYTCALQAKYRQTTGITSNPFDGLRRYRTRTRVIALTTEQILTLVGHASRHLKHALCIAALAPKLRLQSILALRWDRDLDPGLTTITVQDHKTSGTTGLAQVVPVSTMLRAILQDIREWQQADAARHGAAPTPLVIAYYAGRHTRSAAPSPLNNVRKSLKRAVLASGLPSGLAAGVTFHVMRHSIATILANPKLVGPLTERLRADIMGHGELRTTQKYTHLSAAVQEEPHEVLGTALAGLRAAASSGGPAHHRLGRGKGSTSCAPATRVKIAATLTARAAALRAEKGLGKSLGTTPAKLAKTSTKRVLPFAAGSGRKAQKAQYPQGKARRSGR